MTDIRQIEQALSERLEEVEAQLEALAALELERDRLRRALRALRDVDGSTACPARAQAAQPHAPPWRHDRVRRY
jgi:hypothetical protein